MKLLDKMMNGIGYVPEEELKQANIKFRMFQDSHKVKLREFDHLKAEIQERRHNYGLLFESLLGKIDVKNGRADLREFDKLNSEHKKAIKLLKNKHKTEIDKLKANLDYQMDELHKCLFEHSKEISSEKMQEYREDKDSYFNRMKRKSLTVGKSKEGVYGKPPWFDDGGVDLGKEVKAYKVYKDDNDSLAVQRSILGILKKNASQDIQKEAKTPIVRYNKDGSVSKKRGRKPKKKTLKLNLKKGK